MLQEQITGNVVLRVKTGSVVQQEKIPFALSVSLKQKSIDELWDLADYANEFVLTPEEQEKEQEFSVISSSLTPLLFNLDFSKSKDVTSDPPGLTLSPVSVQKFKLKKKLPSGFSLDCFAKETEFGDDVTAIVSFQGLSSSKTISLKTTFLQDEDCKVVGGGKASIPFSLGFSTATGGFEVKENRGGTLALRIGGENGEMMGVDSGYSLGEDGIVSVPFGVSLFLRENRIVLDENKGSSKISLPVDANFIVDPNFEIKQENGGMLVLTPQSTAFFPSGSRLGVDSSQRSVIRVSKNSFVEFVDLMPTPESQEEGQAGETPVAEGSGNTGTNGQPWSVDPRLVNPVPYNGIPLFLPVEVLLRFPPGTISVDKTQASNIQGFAEYYSQRYSNLQGLLLPPSTKFAFDAQATINKATGGLVEVIVPPNVQMVVPPTVVKLDKDSVTVTFPVQMALKFGEKAAIVQGDGGKKHTVIIGEDTAVSFNFEPSFSSTGKTVVVPAFSPVTFVKGARVKAFEDSSVYSQCDFSFKTNEESEIELPEGSVEKEDGSVLLKECQRVNIKSAATGEEFLLTPSVKKIIVSGKPEIGVFSLRVPQNSKITFKVCEIVNGEKVESPSDERKQARITLQKESSVEFPSGSKLDGSQAVLQGFKTITVYDEGAVYDVGVANKVFMTGFSVKEDTGVKQERLFAFLEEGASLSFAPRCEKSSGGVFVSRISTLVIEPSPIEVTLDNSLLSGVGGLASKQLDFPVSVFNKGSAAVVVKEAKIDGSIKENGVAFVKGFIDLYGTPRSSVTIQPLAEQEQVLALFFKIPETAIDSRGVYGSCLKPEYDSKPDSGKLVLITDQKGVQAKQEVDVHVKYDSQSVPCAAKQIEEQLGDIKERGVLASTMSLAPNLDPFGGERLFYFKNEGHVRYASLTNNNPIALKAEFPDDDGKLISCFVFDEEKGGRVKSVSDGWPLASGESVLLECKANAVSGEVKDYSIEFYKSGTREIVKVGDADALVFKVKVFKPFAGMEGVYSSSPVGSLWIGEDTLKPKETQLNFADEPLKTTAIFEGAGFSFAYCQTNFCTFNDAVKAFKNFALFTATRADGELQSQANIDSVCQLLQNQPWKMSFVLNLANSVGNAELPQKLGDAAEEVKKAFPQFDGDFEFSQVPKLDFNGCGSYLIEARLDTVTGEGGFCSFKPSGKEGESRKPFKIEFSAKKLMSCKETLANAPVLMPADDTMFITGNEMTDPGFFGIRTQLAIPVFQIGKYTETASELDLKNAESISNALYSLDPSVFSKLKENKEGSKNVPLVTNSIPFYDDPALCKQNVQPANNLLYRIQYGGAVLATAIGLASIPLGGGATVGVKAGLVAVEFLKAGVVADASCEIIKERASNKCTAIDACTHLRFALAADAIFSSLALPYGAGFKGLLSPAYLVGVAGETIAQPLLAGKLEEPSLPYGGSPIAEAKGPLFESSSASSQTGEFTALPLSPITGAVTALSANEISNLVKKIESLVVNARIRQSLNPDDFSGWEKLHQFLLKNKVSRFSANAPFRDALLGSKTIFPLAGTSQFAGVTTAVSGSDLGKIGSVDDFITSVGFKGSMVKVAQSSSVGPKKNFFQRLIAGLKRTPAGGENRGLRRYGGLLQAVGPTIATLAVSFLTSVQSEPVEAVLGERVSNFVITINYDKNGDPSSSAYCYYDPASKACKKEYRLSLESLCTANEACLYLTPLQIPYAKATPELAGLKTYGLFFAKNQVVEEEDNDYQTLFSSLFDPNSQPDFQGAVDVKVMESVGTPFSYTTLEEEQALDEEASFEQAQTLVDSLADNSQTEVLASMQSQGLVSSDNKVVEGRQAQVIAIAGKSLETSINQAAEQEAS